jgi:phospholipase D1/2
MANDKKAAAAGPALQTYPITDGNRVQFYVLGSDNATGSAGAFADLAKAIKGARHFIFVVDWSFQPLTRIAPRTGKPALSDTVGHMLLEATKRDGMLVAIHTWDHTNVAAPDPMNDDGDSVLNAIAKAMGGFKGDKRPANLLWRMSSRTGFGFSHHQKFVVLDADEGDGRRVIKAFFGGLDLTKGRFDFADSPIVPANPPVEPFQLSVTAGKFSQDDWYNAEFADNRALPRQAWQDFYANIVGPSAWDVVREFVGRWNRTAGSPGSGPGDSSTAQRRQVRDKFLSLFDKGKFVQEWEPHNGPFRARLVRSMVRDHWGPMLDTDTFPDSDLETETPTKSGGKQTEFRWVVSGDFEHSIQLSYLNAIRNADRFIYIETQYLIGSGSSWQDARSSVANQVPNTIVEKIVNRIEHDKPFHAYLVIPMFPEGAPLSSAAICQRNFEFNTMRFMAESVARAAAAKGKDWRDFLSFYFLAHWSKLDPARMTEVGTREGRVAANQRYQAYVHSKLMIVDDQYLILGSANLNERSLAGNRDSEICLSLLASDGKLDEVRKKIRDHRHATWGQHVDLTFVPNLDSPETPMCAAALRTIGTENWRDMAQGIRNNKNHLIYLPFDATATTFSVRAVSRTPTLMLQDPFIFDAEAKAIPSKKGAPPVAGTVIDGAWSWGPSIGIAQKAAQSFAE